MPSGVYERKPRTKEHCENLSKAITGRHLSSEHKEKLRQLRLGWKHPEEVKRKIGRPGALSSAWKDDGATYKAKHIWIRKYLSKPELCPSCKLVPPTEVHNIDKQYRRVLSEWVWMCRKCHMHTDDRLTKLHTSNKGRRLRQY